MKRPKSGESGEGNQEMVEEVLDQLPLIETLSSSSVPEVPLRRKGNTWSAVAHIITGVIGAGVLSLAWSTAQLGWIAGPLMIIVFAATTLVSSYLLSDCYRHPHPEFGILRSSTYMDAVKLYLGGRKQKVCGVVVYVSLCGTTTAYVLTSATSVRQ